MCVLYSSLFLNILLYAWKSPLYFYVNDQIYYK